MKFPNLCKFLHKFPSKMDADLQFALQAQLAGLNLIFERHFVDRRNDKADVVHQLKLFYKSMFPNFVGLAGKNRRRLSTLMEGSARLILKLTGTQVSGQFRSTSRTKRDNSAYEVSRKFRSFRNSLGQVCSDVNIAALDELEAEMPPHIFDLFHKAMLTCLSAKIESEPKLADLTKPQGDEVTIETLRGCFSTAAEFERFFQAIKADAKIYGATVQNRKTIATRKSGN